MLQTFTFEYNSKEYIVEVTRKRMKRIIYRFRDGKILISSPRLVPLFSLKEGVKKFGPKLIEKGEKPLAEGDDFIYIFGIKTKIYDSGEIPMSDGTSIIYKDRNDLHKKLKKLLLKVIDSRQKYYESMMEINPHYKVRIRKVKTIYGSNSAQTHAITYSSQLIHFSFEIIDSLIVHELAHHFVRNHSKKFYEVVLKYYPNYYIYNKMLKRGIFK